MLPAMMTPAKMKIRVLAMNSSSSLQAAKRYTNQWTNGYSIHSNVCTDQTLNKAYPPAKYVVSRLGQAFSSISGARVIELGSMPSGGV